MNEPADAAEWSYRLGDQSYGPLTLSQLQRAADSGLLPPHTALYNAATGASQPAGLLLRYGQAAPQQPPAAGSNTGAASKAAGCLSAGFLTLALVLPASFLLLRGGITLAVLIVAVPLLVIAVAAGVVWIVTRRPQTVG